MAQISFDASGVEPAVPFELLPPGKYRAQIVQSEMQPTKQGDGQMLWLELDILDGPHRGRKLWDRLNLVNRSQQTVEIAQRQLSAICHAIGQIQEGGDSLRVIEGAEALAVLRGHPLLADGDLGADAFDLQEFSVIHLHPVLGHRL